jgi:ligand-binding SRPBCC domain-containing protein
MIHNFDAQRYIKTMKLYKLHGEQIVEGDFKDIWKFFSDPSNLSKITPPDMNFKILTEDLPDR